MTKLSRTQLAILRFLADHQDDRIYRLAGRPPQWAKYYGVGPRLDTRSFERLVDRGYIERISDDFVHVYFNITPAGRAYLEEHDEAV